MRYRIEKIKEKLWMFFVWKLPRKAISWAVLRCWAEATTGKYSNLSPDQVTWDMALKSWDEK